MEKVFALALLLSACCNVAWAATSPLTSTNDYYYTQPKTTNIVGRVMGENVDYRLVRAEDAAFINEAWEERWALGERPTWGQEAVPGGPLVSRRGSRALVRGWWKEAPIEECVLETGDMAGRLAEASGGAMTNIVLDYSFTQRLVSVSMITNQYATLKRAKVLAKEAEVTFTNVDAKVVRTYRVETDESQIGPVVSTNEVQGGEWSINGSGSKTIWDGVVVEEGEPKWAGEETWSETVDGREMSGKVKMRLAWIVGNTNEWMRGAESPKVVKAVHAWAAVEVWGRREESKKTWEIRKEQGGGWSIDTNEVVRVNWSTNATVLVDLGEATWAEAKEGRLVYEVVREMAELTGTATGIVEGMPTLEEVADAAAVPVLSEVGSHEVSKWLGCEIENVYLVIELKPVTSLVGW